MMSWGTPAVAIAPSSINQPVATSIIFCSLDAAGNCDLLTS